MLTATTEIYHICCAAHVLNLMIKKVLNNKALVKPTEVNLNLVIVFQFFLYVLIKIIILRRKEIAYMKNVVHPIRKVMLMLRASNKGQLKSQHEDENLNSSV